MDFELKNQILLTGAGFTKNFGGFLADEMWSHIFNHPAVQASEILRNALKNDLDFESAYAQIIDDADIEEADKQSLRTAVLGAYKNLDDATKNWVFNDSSPYPVCPYTMNEIIGIFNSAGRAKNFIFTLNQDVFMERKYGYPTPGVQRFPEHLYGGASLDLSPSDFITLPSEDIVEKIRTGIQNHGGGAYIKLHGSYGWKSSDGSDRLVIGRNKNAQILKEPLLKAYFDVFKQVLHSGSKKLLIVGYSFTDEHINEIIAEGVREYDLKVYIIDPRSPRFLKENQERMPYIGDILGGLSGYYPYSFKEIFPSNQERTIHLQQIKLALEA